MSALPVHRAVGRLGQEHRPGGGAEGRLRRRPLGRRPDRHPVHDRPRDAAAGPVSFGYAGESDPGPYPVPANAPIEGGAASSGDRHVLIVDRDACRLWELYSAYPQNGGASWTAGSGATWDLRSNAMRTLGWTSGDAAGLPILPGLVRYDEVAAGEIDHVIRFTAPRTAGAYVWPASHKAGTGGAGDPPMGAWFRLKAGYDISHFSAQNQVILRALKAHGMVLADNGSAWYLSGAPDDRWNNSDLNALRSVPGSAFEAVDVSSLKLANTSYAVAGGVRRRRRLRRRHRRRLRHRRLHRRPRRRLHRRLPAPELLLNGGFESGFAGWREGNSRTTLLRVCVGAHGGTCSAQLGRTHSTGDAVLDDWPRSIAATAAGATYTASAWVLAPAGRSAKLRIRELKGTTVVRSRSIAVTGDGTWRQLRLSSAPAAGGTSVSVQVIASLTTTAKALVDDLSLKRS